MPILRQSNVRHRRPHRGGALALALAALLWQALLPTLATLLVPTSAAAGLPPSAICTAGGAASHSGQPFPAPPPCHCGLCCCIVHGSLPPSPGPGLFEPVPDAFAYVVPAAAAILTRVPQHGAPPPRGPPSGP